MSLHRFLSRRDKSKSRKDVKLGRRHFAGSFTDSSESSVGDQDAHKIREIQDLLCKEQVGTFSNDDVEYALSLSYTNGSVQKTVEFLKFLQDSQDLLVNAYDPRIRLLGAANRKMTTCYLDSLLFAMFACHDNYEPMLVNRFEDRKKDRLATLLRLWVNTVRAGKLVTTDITQQIQEAIADCGWADAAEIRQQDAGEAFTLITGQLGLPNLYLKMDLFHHGKEDTKDDHKIVQERLLEMPVPDPSEDQQTVTLEDCAEAALNAKVEVRRFLEERQRRGTVDSLRSQRSFDSTKGNTVHVESVEIQSSEPSTPTSAPLQSPLPFERHKRPLTLQNRTPSIIQESIVSDKSSDGSRTASVRTRAASVRKEVMIPAWQMYSLIPFHTDYSPENDEQVAHHFKLKQPVFGIRLKRYGVNSEGQPTRKETQIDIPVDMAFPTFILDENSEDHSSGFGKFRLSLQSAVCHRGSNSLESGHYVTIARGRAATGEDRWLLFDDLSTERVTEVDVMEALKKETPYLLFYQVQPIEDVPKHAGSTSSGDKDSGIAGLSNSGSAEQRQGSNASSTGPPSIDDASSAEGVRGRTSTSDERRPSIVLTDAKIGNVEETRTNHKASNSLTVAPQDIPQRRSSKLRNAGANSRPSSRPSSSGGHKRLSTSLNRLSERLNGSNDMVDRMPEQPSKPGANTMAEVVIAAQEKEKVKLKKKEGKNKNRLSTHGHLTKNKHSKAPDRECILM